METIDNFNKVKRRIGTTTREIDSYIQVLFINGKVTIPDYENHHEAEYIYDRIVKRLNSEHSHIFKQKKIEKMSKILRIIELKKEETNGNY